MIMQITQFHGIGTSKSGFFVIDHHETEKPYSIQKRAQCLMEKCEAKDGISWITDIDLCSEEIKKAYEPVAPWKMEFIQDRWPRMTSVGEGELTIISDNFISEGIVFQQLLHKTKKKSLPIISKTISWVLVLPFIRIRHLDFTKRINLDDFEYESHLTFDGRSLVRAFKAPGRVGLEKPAYLQNIGLVAAIFVNGRVQNIEKAANNWIDDTYQIQLDSSEPLFAEPNKPLKVTQAFKLHLKSSEEDWNTIHIPETAFRSAGDMLQPLFTKLTFSETDKHFDFMIRRNLEHLLSVCSIPVPMTGDAKAANDRAKKTTFLTNGEQQEDTLPIALTCGDISGHRIVTSASL